jgi:phthalate 4,5-dioxygenase oxygenase subunit
MWETIGPIADRSSERLGASDLAIVQFRRIMVEAAQAYLATGTVIGRGEPHIPHARLTTFEGIIPKTTDWRTLGMSDEERWINEPESLRA